MPAMSAAASLPAIFGSSSAAIGHPPNTLPALRATLESAVDGLVVDIDLSRDGVLVACDDRLVRASCPGVHAVRELAWAELSALGLGLGGAQARTPLSKLDDVLEEFAGWCDIIVRLPLFVHDDTPERAHRIAEHLSEGLEWVDGGVWVMSESVQMLELVRVERDIPTIYRCLEPHLPWELADLEAADVVAVALAASSLRAADREVADSLRVELFAAECDTPAAAAHACEAEVDGLITERPAWLRAWLERNAAIGPWTGGPKPRLH